MPLAVTVMLLVSLCLSSAQAEEPRTFFGKTVQGWLAILTDPARRDEERIQAVAALGGFGPEAGEAVPVLTQLVHQGRFTDQAVEALVRIGGGSEVTVPALIKQLVKQGCDHLTKQGAIGYSAYPAEALGRVGGPAVPALLELLNGLDREMRPCAAEALGEIGPEAGPAVPDLIEALRKPRPDLLDEALARQAIETLGRIGPDAKPALPVLNRLFDQGGCRDFDLARALTSLGDPPIGRLLDGILQDGDREKVILLSWIGPRAREAAPSLRQALADPRIDVRIAAAVALVQIEPNARETVPVFAETLAHFHDKELYLGGVAEALVRLGPRAKSLRPTLVRLVSGGQRDPEFLKALLAIDAEAQDCIPAFVTALKHEDDDIVDIAALCLGLLGPRASQAVPALAATLTGEPKWSNANGYVPQATAAKALARIGAHSAIPALIEALKYHHPEEAFDQDREGAERDYSRAAAAAQALGTFGGAAHSAVPALTKALGYREKDDDNWEVRRAAALALGQIGPAGRAAIPALRKVVDESSQISPTAAAALCRLDPEGKRIAEAWLTRPLSRRNTPTNPMEVEDRALVLGVLGKTSVEADKLTLWFLERLERETSEPHPGDIDWTEHPDYWLGDIARLGVGARLAIPKLQALRIDQRLWLRVWVKESLERIAPGSSTRER